jgi:hypothetical protein
LQKDSFNFIHHPATFFAKHPITMQTREGSRELRIKYKTEYFARAAATQTYNSGLRKSKQA